MPAVCHAAARPFFELRRTSEGSRHGVERRLGAPPGRAPTDRTATRRHAGTPARRVAGSPDAEVTTRIDHHGLSYYVQYEPDSDLTIPGADIDIEDTYEVRTIGIDQDDSKQPALRGAMLDSAYYENQATMSR